MCGITGVVGYNSISSSDVKISLMSSKMINHRGPDSRGHYYDESVVLVSNRLSITDLSNNADQPIVSSDGDVVVVFNGEIYNHMDIRLKLANDYSFSTDHSDTEIIVYAYKKWGIDKALELFNGMFAFALYDKTKNKLYLVRDRLGKKPLYYYNKNKKTYFSSEAHSFFANTNLKKELNEESVYHFLTFLTTPAPKTFFKNIYKLEAGCYLEISVTETRKVKYWDIADHININCSDSFEAIKKNTKQKLERAMAYRYNADVPVTVALSGGIDSSLSLYYSSKLNAKVKAISLSFTDSKEFDESVIAEKFSKELNIDLKSNKIDIENLEKSFLELCDIQKDAPFGDPNTVLLYAIAKQARSIGSKVLIVGEGGDEIGGYPVYENMQKEAKILSILPNLLQRVIKYVPLKKPFDFFYRKNLVSRRQIHGFTELEKGKFWKKEIFNSYELLNKFMLEIRSDLEDSFLRKVLNVEYKLRLPELILARIDYPTMAAGVEARSPFMDHELIEYSASVPFKIKMRNGPKSIVKNIAQKSIPEYILNGEKIGFGMLLDPFLKERLPILFKDEILSMNAPVKNVISQQFLWSIYKRHQKNKQNGYRLWIIYALNKWMIINSFFEDQ